MCGSRIRRYLDGGLTVAAQLHVYMHIYIYTGQAYICSSISTVATAAAVVVEKFHGRSIGT